MKQVPVLVLFLGIVLTSCFQQKPPKPDNVWHSGSPSFESAPGYELGRCPGAEARTQEWQSGLPAAPDEALVIIAAGHGPKGHRDPMSHCYNSDGSRSTITAIGGKGTLEEDELTMALALRLHAVLKRMGFVSELIRDGEYGTEGDCAQKALFRKSPLVNAPNSSNLFCDSYYLSVRGRQDIYGASTVNRLCAGDRDCIKDVFLPKIKHAISRAGQIVRDHAGALGIRYDPEGDNIVHSPKVAYIALHFNTTPSAGPGAGTMLALFSGTVRTGRNSYIQNPALTFQNGSGKLLSSVKKNFVTSVFEHMFLSLHEKSLAKPKSVLPEAENKRTLVYQYVDLVNSHSVNAKPPGGFTADSREGPLKDVRVPAKSDPNRKVPISFNINPPGTGSTGPVTVVSGLGSHGEAYKAKERIIVIPNNVTLEVAHYLDCENVGPLIRSMLRKNDTNFNAQTTPPDPTDPIDVAAEDIAHGLVEYYESYVPGFKQKACDNLKNSDWKDHMPDWCTSGGGGGGADVPDIDDVRPASIDVDVWMTDGAANQPVEVSFGNVGTADLLATISTDSPIANIGPPDVYPAGTAVPLDGSQSVRVPPGERARVEVGFQCTEVGDHTGSIAISSNDPDEPEVTIPMVVHCLSGMYISVGGYDIEKGMFYESYFDPTTNTYKRFYIPEITAVNFVLAADSGWAELSRPKFSFRFTAYNDEYEQLEYWLETPEWLKLTPDRGVLEPDEVYEFGNVEARGFCDGPEEKNGYITIHSNDRRNPSIRTPVRLMCGAIEAEYDPKVYNSMEEPLTEWCGLMHGRGVVKGADHLKELYLEIVYEDIDWEGMKPVGIEYDTPKMSYLFVKDDWSSLRWPQISGDWSWDEHPIFRFYSWTSSCAFDVGTYEVRDFEYGMFKLPSAGTVTIENNAFPGAVYNLAELCVSGSCSPLKVKHKIEGDDQPTRELELEHGLWERSTHSFVAGYHYDVEFLNGDVLVDTASRRVGAFFERDKIIYCMGFVRLNKLRTRDGSSVSLTEPTVYPRSLFWGHVVEYDYEDRTSYVTETLGGAWCYTPWDRQGISAENGELQQAAPPWERGIKPQWVPGELLFCQQEDCDGYRLEIDDADTPSDR